jgi:hypothetical protein
VIEPIWNSKPETANRVRGRIEAVLDWAKVRGFREDENPARWRGHLDDLLPARSKIRRAKHHAALPYEQLGTFMKDLRTREGMAAAALEFLILAVLSRPATPSLQMVSAFSGYFSFFRPQPLCASRIPVPSPSPYPRGIGLTNSPRTWCQQGRMSSSVASQSNSLRWRLG